MSRILLAPMPFTGHVTPLLAVAEQLVAQGHDVRVYTGSAFRTKVDAVGARFVGWTAAPDFDESDLAATFPRLVGKKGAAQLIVNVIDCMIATAPAQVADLEAEWAHEPWDASAGDGLSVGLAHFAEKKGDPSATIAVLPLHLSGTVGPPAGLGLSPGTNPLTRARDAVLRAMVPLMSLPLRSPLARARAGSGLPPASLTFENAVASRELIVASGSPLLDFERADRPEHLHFVGELTRTHSAPFDPPTWWDDLDGRRVVHVTQGTLNTNPNDLLRPALEALATEDVIVIATTGRAGRDELPFPVPPNARVAGFIPHAHLLPRVDVMISNGGWGGTLGALAHGIPLVLAGGDLDKPEIAGRVAWTGAGVNLRTGTPSAAKVRDGYRRVTADSSYRDAAARVGAQMRSLGGASAAAELIGEFAESRARR